MIEYFIYEEYGLKIPGEVFFLAPNGKVYALLN